MDPSDSSCVVSGSLALVLRVSRALGMSPLSMARTRAAWRIAPSPSLAALQGLLMTAFNVAALGGLIWDFVVEPKKRIRVGVSALTAVIWISDLLIMMTIGSITIYNGVSRMRNLIEVLKQLQQINFDLKIIPPSAKSEKVRCFVILCIVVLSTVLQLQDINNITQTAYHDNREWPVMGLYSFYYYPNIVQMMVALQWYYTAGAAYAASATINRRLQQLRYANLKAEPESVLDDLLTAKSVYVCTAIRLRTQAKTKPGIVIYQSQVQVELRHLARSYDHVSEVVMQLTAHNGPIMLLIVLSYCMRLVISPYYLLVDVFGDKFVWSSVLLQFIWILYIIMSLMLIVEPCQWTQDQREHTKFPLCQLTVHLAPKCEQLGNELDQFAKQVQLDHAKFMPLGIFTLSRSLMVTILGSVTTYLLILIQFQKISELL